MGRSTQVIIGREPNQGRIIRSNLLVCVKPCVFLVSTEEGIYTRLSLVARRTGLFCSALSSSVGA